MGTPGLGRDVRSFFCGLLLSVLLGVALVPFLAAPAMATPPSDCAPFDDYQVMARQGTQGGSHVGVRGLVWQGYNQEPSEDCSRLGGIIAVHKDGIGFVELAWILGWDNCGATNDYRQEPYYIAAWRSTIGNYHCEGQGGPYAEGVFSLLTVSDTNDDSVWQVKKGDTVFRTIDINFGKGTTYSFTERKRLYDLAWGHAKSLEWHLLNDSNWSDWSDLDPHTDDDPDYACQAITQREHTIATDPPGCS